MVYVHELYSVIYWCMVALEKLLEALAGCIMGYTCCVPGCRSGYKEGKGKKRKSVSGVRMFNFPSDTSIKQKWILAIPRQDWKVTRGHRVCEKHFSADDFTTTSHDGNSCRRNGRCSQTLSIPRLKPSAVPHLFPSLPDYMSKPNPLPRSSNCSASVRLSRDNAAIEECNEKFMEQDNVQDFASLKEIMMSEIIPAGFVTVNADSYLHYHYIKVSDIAEEPPKLLGSVVVSQSLDIQVFVSSTIVPKTVYQDILNSRSLQTYSQLKNVLARCKSLCDNDHIAAEGTKSIYLKLAAAFLENFISFESKAANPGEHLISPTKFIVDQIELMQMPKHGRRYSRHSNDSIFVEAH